MKMSLDARPVYKLYFYNNREQRKLFRWCFHCSGVKRYINIEDTGKKNILGNIDIIRPVEYNDK